MANQEHIRLVRRGAAAIAEWREKHRDDILDLTGARFHRAHLNNADLHLADLRHANLTGAILDNADLEIAKLSHATLSDARLRATHLRDADLSRANLTEADLEGADLSYANLTDAKLCEAYISDVNFAFATLTGTDFTNAYLSHCSFASVDLSRADGLSAVVHAGASSVGIDTIILSRRKLPLTFLRECGIPQDIIEYLPSLVGHVFDFYSCFISYSSKDHQFAKRLHARLQQEKLRVWFAPEDVKAGRKLYEQIDAAIRIHDKLLLVLSPESMASEWVMTEIRRTRQAERDQGRQKLFPIRLCDMKRLRSWQCFDAETGKDLAVEVREYHIPDFSNWKNHDSFEAAFAKLLRDLRKDEPTARPMPE